MTAILPALLADLRALISDLGKGGGQVSGSVYDTAQVLRFAPPQGGAEAALEWLMARQQPDGGWGNPAAPRSRDTPTLAAVLALHPHQSNPRIREAIQGALGFLKGQAPHWTELTDDLAVGVEITLPRLLDDATALGLDVPLAQYEKLAKLGNRRRQMIAQVQAKIPPGTPAVHSWEAWGTQAERTVIDGSGGVGNSPAATAAWLHAAAGREDLAKEREGARRFLLSAEASTGSGLPGVSPTVYPIPYFELLWSHYALMCGRLLRRPEWVDLLAPQQDVLEKALGPRGIGMSEFFLPDVDDTGAALAVLSAAGRRVDASVLQQFKHGDHFFTYPGEMAYSITGNAHAIHGLSMVGEDVSHWSKFLLGKQDADGRWLTDKWHTSWLYTTTQVMFALEHHPDVSVLKAATDALLRHQRADGGWGTVGHSTPVETSYAVLALNAFKDKASSRQAVEAALGKAFRFLLENYRPFARNRDEIWIGKELYCPLRIDRVFELAAMLTVALAEAGQPAAGV